MVRGVTEKVKKLGPGPLRCAWRYGTGEAAAMRTPGLFSGDEIELLALEGLKERLGFKIADVPDDLIVPEDKLVIQPADDHWAELHRRELLISVMLRRAKRSGSSSAADE
jgi:hypothetical protein